MGRSDSRLSSTRSGVVSCCFLAARIPVLPLAAPVPPLALFRGQLWIPGLRHGCAKNVQTADVRVPGRGAAESFIASYRALPRQLRHAAYAQQIEVAPHSRSS